MFESKELMEALTLAVERRGIRAACEALKDLATIAERSPRVLTIIGNGGMHAIPKECLHGDVYIATQGTLNLSGLDSIEDEYGPILRRLAEKLWETPWEKIYFVPTGPTTLALQIKLLVYHITRIPTIDFLYLSGRYTEVAMDYRKYLNKNNEE